MSVLRENYWSATSFIPLPLFPYPPPLPCHQRSKSKPRHVPWLEMATNDLLFHKVDTQPLSSSPILILVICVFSFCSVQSRFINFIGFREREFGFIYVYYFLFNWFFSYLYYIFYSLHWFNLFPFTPLIS